MVCPCCRLHSPPDTWRCDCGYDFRERSFSAKDALPDRAASFSVGVAATSSVVFNLFLYLAVFWALPRSGVLVPLWHLSAAVLGAFAVFALALSFTRGPTVPSSGWERCVLVFGGSVGLTLLWFVLVAVLSFILLAAGWPSPV